jgi:hypothetical protein
MLTMEQLRGQYKDRTGDLDIIQKWVVFLMTERAYGRQLLLVNHLPLIQ